MPDLVTPADLDSMTSQLDLRSQVQLIRHHNAEARRLRHRLRTEPIYNRTTRDALERRERIVALAEMRLVDQGHHELAGLLAEERQLRARLRSDPLREELARRLRVSEQRVNALLKSTT